MSGNPRLTTNWMDATGRYKTFFIDGDTIEYSDTGPGNTTEAAYGKAVCMVADSLEDVRLVGDGDHILGRLVSVDSDGAVTVQTNGPMYLPAGEDADLTEGHPLVGALGPDDAPGYVRAAGEGDELVAKGEIVSSQDDRGVRVIL